MLFSCDGAVLMRLSPALREHRALPSDAPLTPSGGTAAGLPLVLLPPRFGAKSRFQRENALK
jgi:hypothetical protein